MIYKFFESNMEFVYSPLPCLCDKVFLYCEFYKMLTCFTIFVAFLINKGHAKELNVLIIGNSYTYVHDVPHLVQKLARSSGNK